MRARHGLIFALLLAAACGKDAPTDNTGGTGPIGGTGPGGGSTSSEIDVNDNSYSPDATTVPTGTTVTWTWMGAGSHSVTFTNGGLAGSTAKTSGTFQTTFNNVGVFNYQCSVHGAAMDGKVTVVAP
jgi:plastocyanin